MKLTTRSQIGKKYGLSPSKLDYKFRSKWKNHPKPVKTVHLVHYYDEELSSQFIDDLIKKDKKDEDYLLLPQRTGNFEWSDDMKLIIMFHKIGVRYRMDYLNARLANQTQ